MSGLDWLHNAFSLCLLTSRAAPFHFLLPDEYERSYWFTHRHFYDIYKELVYEQSS